MWHLKTFNELTTDELYKILRLRMDVFIVEQECAYADIDGFDIEQCYHFLKTEGEQVVAYTRILAPGTAFERPSIGRVVTHPKARGSGLGRELMRRSVEKTQELYPGQQIKIGAQCYLIKFYETFGFEVVGEMYLEDGIEHVTMILKP